MGVTEKKALKKRFAQNTKFKKFLREKSILDIFYLSKNEISTNFKFEKTRFAVFADFFLEACRTL
jgi:hypothetical protein